MVSQGLSVRVNLQKEGHMRGDLIHAVNCRKHQGLTIQTLEGGGGTRQLHFAKASEFLLSF